MGSNGKDNRSNGTPREEPVIAYLERVEIENIRSIASLRWEVMPVPGWNVVLGDNGAGKSTFLRAIAFAALPYDERSALLLSELDWVRAGSGAHAKGKILVVPHPDLVPGESPVRQSARAQDSGSTTFRVECPSFEGVFIAGFGPFRRFTGGDPKFEMEIANLPRVERIVTLFKEGASLRESLTWLKHLRFKELEEDAASKVLLASVRAFVDQEGFLPNGAHLGRVTSDHVFFVDGNGAEVTVDDLSDGYRSILSLTFELIRQLAAHYGVDGVFNADATAVIAPGVVLIDEVDAHLHPTWQRRIGAFLRKCFPKIQFIVTTHSPLVCQAAEVGTVFCLVRPGAEEQSHRVTGTELDRLLYGDLADAYATEAMGEIGRSDKGQALLHDLAVLNGMEIDVGLTDDEREKQRKLRRIFGAGPLLEKLP